MKSIFLLLIAFSCICDQFGIIFQIDKKRLIFLKDRVFKFIANPLVSLALDAEYKENGIRMRNFVLRSQNFSENNFICNA